MNSAYRNTHCKLYRVLNLHYWYGAYKLSSLMHSFCHNYHNYYFACSAFLLIKYTPSLDLNQYYRIFTNIMTRNFDSNGLSKTCESYKSITKWFNYIYYYIFFLKITLPVERNISCIPEEIQLSYQI